MAHWSLEILSVTVPVNEFEELWSTLDTFKPGDVVRLKADSTQMVVQSTAKPMSLLAKDARFFHLPSITMPLPAGVLCCWMKDRDYRQEWIMPWLLEKVPSAL